MERQNINQILRIFAAKYIWWKTPDEALHQPERIVAQVMELGDYEDVQTIADQLGDPYLKTVLLHAQAGVFSPKSWAYWHYRLGLSRPGQVPALPKRRLS